MKVLKEYKQKISLSLENIDDGMRALNQHFFNDDQCNHIVDGKMVAKYPKIEEANPNIKEAYYNIRRGFCVTITLQLMEDGSIRVKQ